MVVVNFVYVFGSLFMLLSIITIDLIIGTTDFNFLFTINFESSVQKVIWLGFFIAFAIKTPLIPAHLWLPKAHTSAPIHGSIILAAVVLKLACYLALRVMIPLFPEATLYFTPLVYTLSCISIIYASLTCLRLIDIKEIIAYSSIGQCGPYTPLEVFCNKLYAESSIKILSSLNTNNVSNYFNSILVRSLDYFLNNPQIINALSMLVRISEAICLLSIKFIKHFSTSKVLLALNNTKN
jgi:Proton-conducting membrane transporter